jgi:hypothetical protein
MSSNHIYFSALCSCVICKDVRSAKGIHSHYLASHTKDGFNRVKRSLGSQKSILNRKNQLEKSQTQRINDYSRSPKKCENCCEVLIYSKRKNRFCSHKCAAKISNKKRIENGYNVTQTTKSKISQTLKSKSNKKTKTFKCRKCKSLHLNRKDAKLCCADKHRRSRIKRINVNPSGPFSKICYCSCKNCKGLFIARTQLQFCNPCRKFHSNKRSQYRFCFNVYDYPDLFDIELLKRVGFYAPGGKTGRWNLDGLSRDHKVSISDAIKYNYDPYYISHPCNCELMPHRLNGVKKSKSSIKYEDLISMVNQYDSVKGV